MIKTSRTSIFFLFLLTDKKLCLSTEDNYCEPISTKCESKDGMFECNCRTGFKPWPKHEGFCQGEQNNL